MAALTFELVIRLSMVVAYWEGVVSTRGSKGYTGEGGRAIGTTGRAGQGSS